MYAIFNVFRQVIPAAKFSHWVFFLVHRVAQDIQFAPLASSFSGFPRVFHEPLMILFLALAHAAGHVDRLPQHLSAEHLRTTFGTVGSFRGINVGHKLKVIFKTSLLDMFGTLAR